MSDMHEIILDSTANMFKDYCTKELVDKSEAGEWAEELWNLLEESGLTKIGVPGEADDMGGDYKDALHVLQLAGKYALPLPLAETLMTSWLLSAYSDKTLSKGPCTHIVDPKNKFNIEDTDNGFLINGKKENVPWARHANTLFMLANYNDKIVIALLPLNEATIEENQNLAGEPMDTVIFKDIQLKEVLYDMVDEAEIMDWFIKLGALSKSAMISGAMEKVLELSIQYVKEREQFGRPLHRFQAVQQHISSLAGEVIATLTMINQTIDLFNENQSQADFEIAATKIRVNEAAGKVTELAHQLHGAIGMTHEHRLHQLTRRLWAWREEFGNEAYWASKMSEEMLATPDSNLWEMITNVK